MRTTTRQIAAIAAATKDNCSPNGYGHVVNVFSNGDWMFGISENDVIARGNGNGGWDHRIACLRMPMSRASVAEYLGNIE